MDFDSAKKLILDELASRKRLTNIEMKEYLNDNEELFERIRQFLIVNDLAENKNDVGLIYIEKDSNPLEYKEIPNDNCQIEFPIDDIENEYDIPKPPHFVFISYGRKEDEQKFVNRLHADLKESNIIADVWIDLRKIKIDAWDEKIMQGIKNSTVLLAIISPHAVREGSVCRKEYMFAFNEKKPILPILLKFDQESKLPLLLCDRNWIDFTGDYETAKKSLLNYLSGNAKAAQKPFHPILLDSKKLNFGPEIARYSVNFSERRWVDKKISEWIRTSSSKAFVIIGNPGSGKSAIAAWLSQIRQEQVVGIHFCSLKNGLTIDPGVFVANLVAQLLTQLPEYREILKKNDYTKTIRNPTGAFRQLVIEPLFKLTPTSYSKDKPMLIIIDSLDECVKYGKDNIFELIKQQIEYFPPWLRVITTTRPERPIMDHLGSDFTRLSLLDYKEQNIIDIDEYLTTTFQSDKFVKLFKENEIDREELKKILIEKSDGNFLYAYYAIKGIENDIIDPKDPEKFPNDLVDFYLSIFEEKFQKIDYSALKDVLNIIVVAKKPLTSKEIGLILDKSGLEIDNILAPISSLLLKDEKNRYQVFHNSLIDWLKGDKVEDKKFCVDLEKGNELIIKAFSKGESIIMSDYSLSYLPYHLLESERYSDLVKLLKNPIYFLNSWNKNEFTVKLVWAKIEKQSSYRILSSYQHVIEQPSLFNEEFVRVLAEFLFDIGYHRESYLLLEYVLGVNIEQLDDEKMQYTLSQLAWALDLLGKEKRASELLKINEYISKNRDDTYHLLIGLQYQANILSHGLDCINLYQQQQHLCHEQGEKAKYWLQISIGNEGGLLFALDLYDLAYSMYLEKERICREINNYQGLSWALGYQGSYFGIRKKYDKALELYQQQYEIAQSICYFRGIENSLQAQKRIYEEKKDYENMSRVEKELEIQKKSHVSIDYKIDDTNSEIIKKFSRICNLKEEEYIKSGNQHELARIVGFKAIIAELQNDIESAESLYKKQEAIGNSLNDQIITGNARRNIWRLYWRNKKFLSAEEIYNKNNALFVNLWSNYDYISFLNDYIKESIEKKDFSMFERLLEKQRKYAEDFSLSIPINSLYYHYIQGINQKNAETLKWINTKKPEFDILLQILIKNKELSEPHLVLLALLETFGKEDYLKGNFNGAIANFNTLEGAYKLLGNDIAIEKTLGNIGLAYEAKGEFNYALSSYKEQERICNELSIFKDLSWALCNIGDILRKTGNLHKAYDSYSLCESVSRTQNESYWNIISLIDLGDIHKDWCEFNSACSFYQNSEKISKEKKDLTKLSYVLEGQADIYYSKGNFELALDFYHNALDYYPIPTMLFDQWRILTKISVLYDTLGNSTQFEKYINKKRKLISKWSPDVWFSQLLGNQDHLHRIRFDFIVFYEWYKKRNVLRTLSEKEESNGSISSRFGKYRTIEQIISPDEINEFLKFGELCLETSFKMGIQYFYSFRGMYELMNDDLNGALLSFTTRKELCEKMRYRDGVQMSLGMIADINYKMDDFILAESLTNEQKILAHQLEAKESLLNCHQRLTDISVERCDMKKARELFEAHDNMQEIGLFYHKMINLKTKARISHLEGQVDKEISYYQELEHLSRDYKDTLFADIAFLKLDQVSN